MPHDGGIITGNNFAAYIAPMNIKKFCDYSKTLKLPYYIAADFETYNSMLVEPDLGESRSLCSKDNSKNIR